MESDAAVAGGGVDQEEPGLGTGKKDLRARLQAQEAPSTGFALKPSVRCCGALACKVLYRRGEFETV